jgi:hypothetical protein
MPKHGMLIAGLLMLCVSAAGGDQLLRWAVKNAARSALTPPTAGHADARPSIVPVSLLGSAMAMGAQPRLDRAASDLPGTRPE